MITFKREETKKYSFAEALIEVTYRIPDALEAEQIIADQSKDTDVFKKFVLSVKSADVEGWADGVKAEDVTILPGVFGLVHLVAVDIVKSMRVDVARKN